MIIGGPAPLEWTCKVIMSEQAREGCLLTFSLAC